MAPWLCRSTLRGADVIHHLVVVVALLVASESAGWKKLALLLGIDDYHKVSEG
jgi:hypothetical protein